MWGLDFLAIAKYQQTAVGEFPNGWALGAFTNVFGDALPAINAIARTGRCPRIRLHLMWKDDHRYSTRDFAQIRREAMRVKPTIQRFPKIEWRISGACEHNLVRNEATALKKTVLDVLPMVTYVNTPWVKGGGALIASDERTTNELHGADALSARGRFDYSFDGDNSVDSDIAEIARTLRRAETFYVWNSQCNGRKTTGDTTPRAERQAWPTSNEIDSWIALSNPPPIDAITLPAKWTYKSHADRHDTPPEPRAGKPVWIAPIKSSEILLRSRNGQIVERASYYGTFTGGGYRYYAPQWGYITAEKAKRVQGDALCDVVINGKKVGIVHPAFRAGTFR